MAKVQADVDGLKEALTLEFLKQSRDPPSDCEVYLENIKSGLVHRALQSTEAPELSQGTSHCGWPFHVGENAMKVQELPALYKDLCERCFTTLRGARKRRLLGSGRAGGSELGSCDPGPDRTPGPLGSLSSGALKTM